MHSSQPRPRAGLLVHVQLTATDGSPSLIVLGPCRGNQGSFFPPPPHRKGHSGWGGNEQGSHGALCRPCGMITGPQHASHARGTGGCGIAGCGTAVAATTRGIPGCWGGVNGVCRFKGGGL